MRRSALRLIPAALLMFAGLACGDNPPRTGPSHCRLSSKPYPFLIPHVRANSYSDPRVLSRADTRAYGHANAGAHSHSHARAIIHANLKTLSDANSRTIVGVGDFHKDLTGDSIY